MDTRPTTLALFEEIHRLPVDSQYKMIVMQIVDGFFVFRWLGAILNSRVGGEKRHLSAHMTLP